MACLQLSRLVDVYNNSDNGYLSDILMFLGPVAEWLGDDFVCAGNDHELLSVFDPC